MSPAEYCKALPNWVLSSGEVIFQFSSKTLFYWIYTELWRVTCRLYFHNTSSVSIPRLMDTTTTQGTYQLPTTSGSNWSLKSTTILDEYSCKPFQSDTTVSKEVKILFYCVLLLFSVLANSLLIAIIKGSKEMKAITNYLITNMAVSDILFLFIYLFFITLM